MWRLNGDDIDDWPAEWELRWFRGCCCVNANCRRINSCVRAISCCWLSVREVSAELKRDLFPPVDLFRCSASVSVSSEVSWIGLVACVRTGRERAAAIFCCSLLDFWRVACLIKSSMAALAAEFDGTTCVSLATFEGCELLDFDDAAPPPSTNICWHACMKLGFESTCCCTWE